MSELRVRCDAPIGGIRLRVDVTLTSATTALFGPSGVGKSSLLRLIAGLWTPRGSAVWLGGAELTHVSTHRRRIALVAQEPALFPHLNVEQNIRFGIPKGGKLDELLDLFDLESLRHARTQTLSGGERKRVAMARALATEPRLLLLDEVFTGMHRTQRNDLIARVRKHCAQRSISILSVTHDPAEALLLNDETILIDGGKITAQGATREVLAGETTEVLSSPGRA